MAASTYLGSGCHPGWVVVDTLLLCFGLLVSEQLLGLGRDVGPEAAE